MSYIPLNLPHGGILLARGVFDGASGAAAAALFVGAQNPSGHK